MLGYVVLPSFDCAPPFSVGKLADKWKLAVCTGTLDGSAFPSRSRPDWLKGGAVAAEPRNVLLPTRARAISCGRRHVLILDEEHS